MRVVCDVKVPKFDSAGRTGSSSSVYPFKQDTDEIKTVLYDFLEPMRLFKEGMEINIRFEEDWNDESNI